MTTKALRTAVFALAVAAVLAASVQRPGAQSAAPVPFKVGTFERAGQEFVGLVLRDTEVVHIAQANAAFEKSNPSAARLTAPADMKQLIARYDSDWKARLAAIAREVSAAKTPPAYAHALDTLKVLPRVRPSIILNAGGNYVEHTAGIAAQQQRAGAAPQQTVAAVTAPGIWERKPGDTRENPYLFQKSPTVATGPYDPMVSDRLVPSSCRRSS